MSFTGRYTHLKEILERVRRDYAFEEVYQDECKEWIWDIIGYVGVYNILEDKTEELTVEEHRTILPSDMYDLIAIREKDTNITLLPATDKFYEQNVEDSSLQSAIITSKTYNVTFDEIGDDLVTQDETVTVDGIGSSGYVYEQENYTYKIQGSYLFCGLEETTLQISYKGFPIWDDYTPKIPDDAKFIRLVASYIAYKIAFRMKLQGKFSREDLEIIEQDYLFNVGSARNRMLLPNEDEMELIRRMSMRILPKPSQYSTGSRYISSQERLRKI